jgi:hypothetical protein
VNPYLPDRGDLVFAARRFAEEVGGESEECQEYAQLWADAYFRAAVGEFILLANRDGCAVLTRDGYPCSTPRQPDDLVCHFHRLHIDRRQQDRADA